MRNYLCANYNDIREAISRKFRHYVAHCIVKLLSGNGEFSFYLLLARSLVGCICVSLGSSRGSVSLRLKITRCCPWNTRVSWNSTIFDSSTHLASIKPISEDRKKKMVRWKSKSTETEIDERNENFDSTRKQPDKQLHPSAAHNEISSFHSATTAGVAFWYFERRTVCTDSARVAVVYRCVDNDVDRRWRHLKKSIWTNESTNDALNDDI